jgi:hypothetical protein
MGRGEQMQCELEPFAIFGELRKHRNGEVPRGVLSLVGAVQPVRTSTFSMKSKATSTLARSLVIQNAGVGMDGLLYGLFSVFLCFF